MNPLKYLIKRYAYYYYIRNRFDPAVQIQQRSLYLEYRKLLGTGSKLPDLNECGFRVFSQFEEDGLLFYIFSLLGMSNKTFVDIGSMDGVNSNCANLYFHHGWHGIFMDGDSRSIKLGRHFYSKYPTNWNYKPVFVNAYIKAENVNQLIEENGYRGEIGLLSVDIDGNDYWVWKALDVVQPQVVIIETHNEFGLNNIVVPYDPDYVYPGKHPVYHGASPVAMTKLAGKKGYRLVGANQYGFNFIFVRNDLLPDILPEVSVESVLQHPSVKEGYKKFDAIKDWEYLEG